MYTKTVPKTCFMTRLLVLAALATPSQAQEAPPKPIGVTHPNLLLNQKEIEQIKLKIKEQAWAARLLERVKVKAEKEEAALEAGLAYVLTGEAKYASIARRRLLREARDQMPRYEKLDVKDEPEWGRWTWWGNIAWAYDLAYGTFTAEERAEVERWLRAAARMIIEQEKVLTTTPNLVFCEHWRVGMIGYCLGDAELIEWALRDPGLHGPLPRRLLPGHGHDDPR